MLWSSFASRAQTRATFPVTANGSAMSHSRLVSTVFGEFDPTSPNRHGGAFDAVIGPERIAIAAPIATVWHIMVDFDRYLEWNPLNRRTVLEAPPQAGTWLMLHYTFADRGADGQLPPAAATNREQISVWEPLACFSYADVKPLFRNERTQYLQADGPDRTWYYTYERFTGLLTPLVTGWYGSKILNGFRRNGVALKQRAEASQALSR